MYKAKKFIRIYTKSQVPSLFVGKARFITSEGLLDFLSTSRKPNAPAVRAWITEEVIPQAKSLSKHMIEPSALDKALLSAYEQLKSCRNEQNKHIESACDDLASALFSSMLKCIEKASPNDLLDISKLIEEYKQSNNISGD
jgi:prophage antirepressor-like protein